MGGCLSTMLSLRHPRSALSIATCRSSTLCVRARACARVSPLPDAIQAPPDGWVHRDSQLLLYCQRRSEEAWRRSHLHEHAHSHRHGPPGHEHGSIHDHTDVRIHAPFLATFFN